MINNLLSSLLQNTSPVTIVANENIANKPIVTPLVDKNNVPRVDFNGRQLASIRLEQHQTSLTGTFLNARNRVAFVGGTYEELMRIVEGAKLVAGSTLPGKIVIKESLFPMYKNQTSKINPQTAEQVGVTVNGNFYPVYMQMIYTENLDEKDVLIRTVNDALPILMNQQVQAATQNIPIVETANVPVGENINAGN